MIQQSPDDDQPESTPRPDRFFTYFLEPLRVTTLVTTLDLEPPRLHLARTGDVRLTPGDSTNSTTETEYRMCRTAPRTVYIYVHHPVNLHLQGGCFEAPHLRPRPIAVRHTVYPHRGSPDAGCRGMQTVSHDVPWASQCVASRLERMPSQPAHVSRWSQLSQLLPSRHTSFSVSSSTRLETMTCYLQTSCLETRKPVLPSVCLKTTSNHVEIPCLKKTRDVSTISHL